MKFEGIIPALVTPYDDRGEVNYGAVRALVERLIENGVGGLFVCGSTGEWWLLTPEERMRIVETVVETVRGRIKVMAHIGASATRDAVRLAQHAEKAGAQAISALPPVGFRYPAESVWDHFKAISTSCSLPMYLYHLPQIHGDLISLDRLAQTDELPTLAGVKFSAYQINDLVSLRLKAGDRLNILSGCAEQLLSAIACGAEGSICTWYNLFPRLGVELIRRVRANDIAGARKLQDTIQRYSDVCVSMAAGNAKWLIGFRGIPVGPTRLPLPYPSKDEQARLLPKVQATGILDWCI